MLSSRHEIVINIGGLEGIPSVYKCTSKGLQEFNESWKSGELSSICWDLRSLKNKKLNMTAISFFLAIANRVRQFVGCAQKVLINWNPQVLGFLVEIGFFEVANLYDLFEWPYEIGGYEVGRINPNTKLLSYDSLSLLPDVEDTHQLSDWKKIHRENYRKDIISKCEALFMQKDEKRFGTSLALVMSRTCAEISINSLLWGHSAAFLGLQRSRKNITISISDIGVGFKSSLLSRSLHESLLNDTNSDINSVIIGSVLNENDFGLKRAIATVIEFGGSISIASNSGEILWGETLWKNFIECFNDKGIEFAISTLPTPIYKAEYKDKKNGYIRKWKDSIRGARVSFNIPINIEGEE